MTVDFDENSHSYTINGNIAMLSFTELLHKHKLAPDFKGVNKDILKQSAEFGKEIHSEIENIVNNKNYEPQTEFGKTFLKYSKENFDSAVAELRMGLNYKGYLIAGTADLVGFLKGDIPFIADNKTTSKKDIEYWSWQNSLANYALKKLGKELLNDKPIHWKGAEKIFVLWFDKKTGKLQKDKPVELEIIPDKEIERLLECELNGEIYQRQELIIEKALANEIETIEQKMVLMKEEFKFWEDKQKEYREELLKIFKKQGILSWESPNKKFKITYVPPTEQLRVDSKELKLNFPQVYAQVSKVSKKKDYLLIKERKDD